LLLTDNRPSFPCLDRHQVTETRAYVLTVFIDHTERVSSLLWRRAIVGVKRTITMNDHDVLVSNLFQSRSPSALGHYLCSFWLLLLNQDGPVSLDASLYLQLMLWFKLGHFFEEVIGVDWGKDTSEQTEGVLADYIVY
jgi:hypothetical protein